MALNNQSRLASSLSGESLDQSACSESRQILEACERSMPFAGVAKAYYNFSFEFVRKPGWKGSRLLKAFGFVMLAANGTHGVLMPKEKSWLDQLNGLQLGTLDDRPKRPNQPEGPRQRGARKPNSEPEVGRGA